MLPKFILSICGDSAVGKGTLIDKISDREQIRARFDVVGDFQFYATRESGKTRSGKSSYYKICTMYEAPFPTTIVHRWQFNTNDYPENEIQIQKLKMNFPDARHKVVVLWRDWTEHAAQRLQVSYNMDVDRDRNDIEHVVRSDWERIADRFGPGSELSKAGFDIELVDSGTEFYRKISWNSVL